MKEYLILHVDLVVILWSLQDVVNTIRLYTLNEITEIFSGLGLCVEDSYADFSGRSSSENEIQFV